jgi:hypothetical protein
MKMGMKTTGANELAAALFSKAKKVPDNARKVMHAQAKIIVREAKLNAPVDDRELEDSIAIKKSYEERGRLRIEIVAGGVVRGVDVSRYAMIIHENYEGQLKNGPGKNTLAKMAANPGRWIGSKFLERARQAQQKKLMSALIHSVTTDLEGL